MAYNFGFLLGATNMTFDSEEHKKLVQALLLQASFPGNLLEAAYTLKQAVDAAQVTAAAVTAD